MQDRVGGVQDFPKQIKLLAEDFKCEPMSFIVARKKVNYGNITFLTVPVAPVA